MSVVARAPEPEVERRAAIDLLGTLGHPGGCASLRSLVATETLDDDELERTACSLGEIVTTEAVEVLRWMGSQPYAGTVAEEIAIALDRAGEGRA